MSAATAAGLESRFDQARMAEQYHELFLRVLNDPGRRPEPRRWSAFRVEPAYQPTWRGSVPQRIKTLATRMGVVA
jgi:hypothetical protein